MTESLMLLIFGFIWALIGIWGFSIWQPYQEKPEEAFITHKGYIWRLRHKIR